MKNLLTFILCLISVVSVKAQTAQPADTLSDAFVEKFLGNRHDAIAALQSKEYQKAFDLWSSFTPVIAAERKNAKGDALRDLDSLGVDNIVMRAKCMNRLDKRKEAIALGEEAISAWRAARDSTSRYYAILLDNYATYLESDYQSQRSLEVGKKALGIYSAYLENDFDKALILIHIAESCNELKMHADAIRYELQGLSIFNKVYGEHSEEYGNELEWLSKYYAAAGQQKKADEVDERLDRLNDEAEQGYGDIPAPINFEDSTECTAHIQDALRCAEYYTSHKIQAHDMGDAGQWLMNWVINCNDIFIVPDEETDKLLAGDAATSVCAIAFFAGCVKYAINNDDYDFSLDTYRAGVVAMINFYLNHEDIYTGKQKIASLEKYVKAYNSDGIDGVYGIADKIFEKTMKRFEKEQTKEKK